MTKHQTSTHTPVGTSLVGWAELASQLPVHPRSLKKGCLALQNFKSLLQPCDLCAMATSTFSIGLRLFNTLLFNLRQVLHDRIELSLYCRAVSVVLRGRLVKLLRLLPLVLHALPFGGSLNFVFFAHVVILCDCSLLVCNERCQSLGHVRLNGLQEANNTRGGTDCSSVSCIRRVIFFQEIQRQLNPLEALLLFGLARHVLLLLLSSQLVHLRLRIGQLSKLILQCGDLCLQLGRLGRCSVYPRAKL